MDPASDVGSARVSIGQRQQFQDSGPSEIQLDTKPLFFESRRAFHVAALHRCLTAIWKAVQPVAPPKCNTKQNHLLSLCLRLQQRYSTTLEDRPTFRLQPRSFQDCSSLTYLRYQFGPSFHKGLLGTLI